jgi:hypothetical protein
LFNVQIREEGAGLAGSRVLFLFGASVPVKEVGRRPVTSYYGGGDAIIPMRIDYVVGTAIAIAWEHLSLEERNADNRRIVFR